MNGMTKGHYNVVLTPEMYLLLNPAIGPGDAVMNLPSESRHGLQTALMEEKTPLVGAAR